MALEDPIHVAIVAVLRLCVGGPGGGLHGVGPVAAGPRGQVLEHALVVQGQHLLQALRHRV